MSFRFQWRPIFGPFKFNFSKRGLSSIGIGRRGAWFTIGAGGERVTVGAPGSGLFCSKFKSWRRRAAPPDTTAQPQVTGAGDRVDVHEGHVGVALLIVFLVGVIVTAGIFGR